MVHQYKLNGYNIVLDTCSGSIHSVDEVAYDIIAMVAENKTEADVKECLEDIDALKEAKKLFTPDTYEHLAFDFKARNTVIKALCLHVAHTCNLNCSYCFASQGK